MFDIGIQELIVIFVVALLVFGPKRLPELGKTLGKGMAEIKRAMYNIKEQMDSELKDIKKPDSLLTDEQIKKISELESQNSKIKSE
ncbi:MAG: twin-arginine translocase subunit TatB [Nitrospirae bacterium]|nr:twin-arginine translocase subunit TatB [Nitrospirota bacterium]